MQAMLDDSADAPGIEQLVNGAVATVARTPAAAFPLTDMLVSLCTQDNSKNKQQVFKSLVQHLSFGRAEVRCNSAQRSHVFVLGKHPLVSTKSGAILDGL